MIRFTFLRRLKARFRPSRPAFDKAAFQRRFEANIVAFEAKMKEMDAKTSEASERLSGAHKSASDAVSAVWVKSAIWDGTNQPIPTLTAAQITATPHPDYAEIIRIADALYRLAGVKK